MPGTEWGRVDCKVQHKGILEAMKVFWLDPGHGYTSLGICQNSENSKLKRINLTVCKLKKTKEKHKAENKIKFKKLCE